jgi:SAM-dependent methyltransferase
LTKKYDILSNIFSRYNVNSLVNISAEEFETQLKARIGVVDFEIEGYKQDDLATQRDLSIKFHWGHNHDFGTFSLDGRMGDRHVKLLEEFLDVFPVTLDSFFDSDVLDIGCWTGGTTLLLSALSNSVTAVEEVKKYADTTQYLIDAFGLNSEVLSTSLYELNCSTFYDKFDRVYFPGVIYHLSDPVLSLRILFNSLKDGGDILIETAGIDSKEPICRFDGNYKYHQNGTREELNRGGWNYFIFSSGALELMMKEAGFEDIKTHWNDSTQRLFAYGIKKSQLSICKAGLSVPSIK